LPLPESSGELKWPPPEWQPIYARYAEHAAWFSGDPAQLIATYLGAPVKSSVWRTNFDRFWARGQLAPQRRQMLHIPMAGDIATTSSDLLFSEPPRAVIEEEEGKTERPVQKRLDELIEKAAVYQTLSEGGETGSALGGVFFRVTWDKTIEPDHPLFTSVDVDKAVPEFRWGRLMAVTFWENLQTTPGPGMAPPAGTSKEVWRHLERHEPGVVLHGLYHGDIANLGTKMPLDSLPLGFKGMDVIETGVDRLTACYVPNMRPNRLYRGSPLGRSDYDGVEAIMDSLDEVWTSWMRDLRLARARLIVPKEIMDPQGKGQGAFFDVDQEVFESLDMPPGKELIVPSQFAIRTKEHAETALALVERIVAAAGYSASTFGLQADKIVAQTATEITNRERRTYVTRAKKITYWSHPLAEILETLLEVDAAQFGAHDTYRPRIDFPTSIRQDVKENATIIGLLRNAEAASVETRVRMAHPEWNDEMVDNEVESIRAEGGSSGKTKLTEVGQAPPPEPTVDDQGNPISSEITTVPDVVAPTAPPPNGTPTVGVKPIVPSRVTTAPPSVGNPKA
jgi:hypothetical protein